MKFEEWFDEQEGARTRRDRFIDDFLFRHPFLGIGKDWLHAAYNAGFKEGSKQPVPLTVTTAPHIKYPTPSNPSPTQPVGPNIKSCSKCGINLIGVMGYVCYDMKCPTQMRISSGSVGAMGSLSSNIRYVYGDIKK